MGLILGTEACMTQAPDIHDACLVVFQNFQRLPIMASADRSTQLVANIKDHRYDCVMSSNVGINWDKLPVTDSWIERTRRVLGSHPF
jgi:hypothetical protein